MLKPEPTGASLRFTNILSNPAIIGQGIIDKVYLNTFATGYCPLFIVILGRADRTILRPQIFEYGKIMIRKLCVSFAVLAFSVLSACTTVKVGHEFDVGVFAARVEQGVTTQAMVKSWLGEPASTGYSLATDNERFEEWSYYFAEGRLNDMSSARTKILQIKFDLQGKVRGYSWSATK